MNSRYRYRRFCVRLCIALLALVGCKNRNQESAWNGTWKMNLAESRPHGAYFTVGIAPDGLVTVANAAYSYSFRCNDKEFQSEDGRTTVCVAKNNRQWILTYKTHGKDTGTYIWDISPDDNTLKIHSSQGSGESTFTRRDGMNGIAGRWQETDALRLRPKILQLALEGRRLHFVYPEVGQYTDSPLDGTIVPIHGPRVRQGMTYSVKAISPQELQTQMMFSGRVIHQGTLAISEDGRVLYQEFWSPENPGEKDRLVYDKQ